MRAPRWPHSITCAPCWSRGSPARKSWSKQVDSPSGHCYILSNVRWMVRNSEGQMVNQGGFIAYYRVSTARQGKSGLGIAAQRQAVESYLNGGDWRIIGEYTEIESGRRVDRPELDKALAAARIRQVPLVVAKVDRLTRSLAFLTRLQDAGVDVRFADLPAIEGATGRFLLQQMAAVAELEAGMISARTKAALAAAKRRGVKLGGARGAKITTKIREAGRAVLQARAQ